MKDKTSMKRKSRLVFLGCFLVATLAAAAEENTLCKTSCESDKQQCRGLAVSQTETDMNPPWRLDSDNQLLDRKRDMRSVLEDKQRRSDTEKNLKFERSQECTKAYMQCMSLC